MVVAATNGGSSPGLGMVPASTAVRTLAAANDLLPAAAAVVPGLVSLRRALTRLLRLPIGLSGSGPSLWALYPSLESAEEAAAAVRSAIDSGEIARLGDQPPFVAATTIQRSDR